jgi:hypothetical protein
VTDRNLGPAVTDRYSITFTSVDLAMSTARSAENGQSEQRGFF